MKSALKYAAPGLLAASLFVSCDDKQPGSGDVSTGNPVTDAVQAVLPTSSETIAKRAESLGFAQHLPKETECIVGFYRGKELLEQLRGSELGKWLEARGEEEGIDLDEVEESPEAQMVASLFAEEAILAFGDGTGSQGNLLVKAGGESNYLTLRDALTEVARATGEDGPEMEDLVLERMDQYLSLLSTAEMPPVTIALKGGKEASEGLLPMILSQLEGGVNDAPPGVVTKVEFQRVGANFEGYQVNGEKVAELVEAELGEEVPLSSEQKAKAIALISERDLVVAAGVVGEHLVIMVGPSVDDCQLVEKSEDSVIANDSFRFVDQHTSKPVIGVMFASKELQDKLVEGYSGYQAYSDALKDGLKGIPAFGDTRELTLILDNILKQEADFRSEIKYSDFGAVALLDEGVRLEAYGGMNYVTLDSESAREFAPLSATQDLFLFANWKGDEEMVKKQSAMLDSFGELVWLFANKAAGMDIDIPELDEFKGMFGMINEQFGDEIGQVVDVIRGDLPEGFGTEGAVVVDLKGQVPSGIPMIPPVLVEKGKLPRVTYVQKVDDRSKLSDAWVKLENVTKSVLKKTESGITMPSFLTSEKDGLVSYFYPFPFQTDDFLLNLTVGDEVFFLSSSKSFVYELNGRYKAGPADSDKTGAVVEVHFDVLRAYAQEWLALVDENAEEIFPSDAQVGDFNENKQMIKDFLGTLDGLEGLDFHMREEDGLPRTSLHLKIK